MDLILQLFSSLTESEYVKALFGPELVRYLLMVGVVIGTVGKHFKEMRDELKNVRLEIHDFKDVFRAENRNLKKQQSEVEARIEALDYRVGTLEITVVRKAD